MMPDSSSGRTTWEAPRTHDPWSTKLTALHLREDEKGTCDRTRQPVDSPAPSGCQGADRRVGRRVGGRGGRQDLLDVASRQVGEDLDVRELQPWFGERPGLVDAQHVDAGQSLHGGQLLDQHPMARQPECPDGEGHRRQQHQSLGHHGGDPGDRSPQGVGRWLVAPEELGDEERDPDRDHDPGHEAQDLVGPLLQLGADQSEPAGLSLEPPCIGHLPDPGRPDPPRAGDHEGSRQHRFAGRASVPPPPHRSGGTRRLRDPAMSAPGRRRRSGRPDVPRSRRPTRSLRTGCRRPDRSGRRGTSERPARPADRAPASSGSPGRFRSPCWPPGRCRRAHPEGGPTTTATTNRDPKMALKRVSTLARTIWPTVRPVVGCTPLALPARTRSWTCASESPTDASSGVARSPDAEVAAEGTIASGEPINAGAGRSSPMSGPSCWLGTAWRPVDCLSLAYLPLPPHALLGPNDLVHRLGRTFGPGDVEMPGSR